MRLLFRTFSAGLLGIVAATLTGCASHQPGPGTVARGGQGEAGGVAVWPFWPERMRIHPATRITRDPAKDQTVLETRLEFFDRDGVPTKAVGQLTIQLVETGPGSEPPRAIETWNMDLRDLDLNRRQFDDVMLTYLFRLQLGQVVIPERAELKAYFLSANGQELQTSVKLRPGAKGRDTGAGSEGSSRPDHS